MNIEIKDTLILDDNNEYVVTSKINYENITYYYLIDKNDPDNIIICKENNTELIQITNNELINKLSPIFLETTYNILKEDNNQ